MSEKFSGRNSRSVSPLRSNAFIGRGVNPSKTTSKRNGVKRTGERIIEDKKHEVKNNRESCRDDLGTSALNLTLVGSPAPRSQVRAFVSSSNVAARSKVKTSYSSKSREQNPHEICMEKLYQFADNPTKFVQTENRDEPQLQLDLEFSDRSEESENFYNSHNIAFGENGEYRIPEYDHIRFLQFSIGNTQDPGTTEDRDNSASVKFDRSTVTCAGSENATFAKENRISRIPDGSETPKSHHADGNSDLSDAAPQIDEINPWNSKVNHTFTWSKSNAAVDTAQNYPLGSAINYKNNINPEVERFMLDTGPESLDDNHTRSTQNNRLVDESILSKNFAQAIRLQPFEGSAEDSSRSSPVTSRTTLSQASSGDGTWHGHSLNSPYFASTESNSWTASKRNVNKDLSKAVAGYQETDEYLTIVKNEEEFASTTEKGGVQRYIFITNQFLGSELHNQSNSESVDDNSLKRSSVTESSDSLTKMDRSPSAEIGKLENDDVDDDDDGKDISNGESSSDYCIGNIFSRTSSLYTTHSSSSSSSSSSSIEDVQPMKTETSSTSSASFGDRGEVQDEGKNMDTALFSAPEVENLNLLKESLSPNALYMTLDEVNLAADYTSKLSQIFNRVLERSECENRVRDSKEVNVNCSSSTSVTSRNTSKLIYTCLGSPEFCTRHPSS